MQVPQYGAGCSVPGGAALLLVASQLGALGEGWVLIFKKSDKLRHSYVSAILKKVQSGMGSRQRRGLDSWCCRMLWLSPGALWRFPALFTFSLPRVKSPGDLQDSELWVSLAEPQTCV